MKIKNLYNFPHWFLLLVIFSLIVSIYIRAQGLGYSNFQGDEVNTVDFIYEMKNNDVIAYLFDQKRGPTQYVINLINYSFFGYSGEFLIRLPYLLFGIFALFTIYKLASETLGKNSALIASLLMAINGLFIAFSRITQYQAVMYSIIPIAVYFFLKSLNKKSIKGMALTGLLMSVALLTHYDTLSVLPFFIVMFLGRFIRHEKFNKANILKYIQLISVFGVAFFLPAISFYVPFTLSHEFESRTSGYLGDRLLGGGLMPRTKLTLYLISMYQPVLMMATLYFAAVGSAVFYYKQISLQLLNIKLPKKIIYILYLGLIGINAGASYMSLFYFKPRLSTVLVVLSSIAIAFLLFISRKINTKYAALMAWFLGAYSMYFYLVKDPRTHVYVVFVPAFILAGYTFYKLFKTFEFSKTVQSVYLGVLSLGLIYILGFNWMIFADRKPEYPWFDKDYFGNQIFEIPKVRHKKIDGVFGFNQWRGWEITANYLNNGCLNGSFDSNEKNSITYFYTRKDQSRGEEGFVAGRADNLVVVEGPHSWEYQNLKVYLGYDLVHIIKSNDIPVTFIYSRNYNPDCFPDGSSSNREM